MLLLLALSGFDLQREGSPDLAYGGGSLVGNGLENGSGLGTANPRVFTNGRGEGKGHGNGYGGGFCPTYPFKSPKTQGVMYYS